MVFMSLLLVVFLIQPVLSRSMGRGQGHKVKLGEAFGKDVFNTDTQNAAVKRSIAEGFGFYDAAAVRDPLDYYLLLEEARRAGVRMGTDQVKRVLSQAGATDRQLARLQQEFKLSYNRLYEILGEWLAVRMLCTVQASALDTSLPRAELAYRDEKQKADVRLSVLDSYAFLNQVPAPTEKELQDFFEEARDREPVFTEDEVQYGYRQPDRVQKRTEYLL